MTTRSNNVLVLTVGLPRAGKSTWAKQRNIPMVNPDSIRLALHGYAYIKEAEGFVWAIAHKMVEALFIAGHSTVILDATNTTVKARQQWRSNMWVREFVVFNTSASVCKQRALAIHRTDLLPVIDRMAEQYEPVTEEELEECILSNPEMKPLYNHQKSDTNS